MKIRVTIMTVLLLILLGCASNPTMEEMKRLGFPVYVPEYIPNHFQMTTNLDTDHPSLSITYQKEPIR